MSMPPGVMIVLMPLKLLQGEQNAIINQIPNGKAIALTGENNQPSTQRKIASGNYTHLFTGPKIALSKKFKKNLLDNAHFSKRLCLLAIDEIHLVEQWGKSFRPLYAEIEKIHKQMLCHSIPLFSISATLTKQVRSRILEKSGFFSNYKLMQTFLDRPEIMQVHRFIKYAKASCLDLEFILPKQVKKAREIQKTVIFVNSIKEI